MTLHHRICALDYIPDKCRNIGESEDYRELVRKLDQNLTDVKQLAVDAEERKKAIEVYYADITKMISEFRKEINERLDQLQNKLLQEAKDMMTEDKQKAQRVLDSCTNIIYDIKKFQSSLHDQKIAEQNEQLFITMKRAQSNLKTDEIMNNETALDETDVQYEFKRSKDVEIILERDIFGKIYRHPSIRKRCNQKARLCTLRKLPNLRSDFGFNLQADRGRTSHYIGKVDDFSPAQAAGVKEGDRIVEVDGANTDRETHSQVVGRIKAAGNSLTLLVVDDETDKYYREKKVVISSQMPGLIRLGNPIYRNAEKKY